jgi:hypothetical protein
MLLIAHHNLHPPTSQQILHLQTGTPYDFDDACKPQCIIESNRYLTLVEGDHGNGGSSSDRYARSDECAE